MSGGCIREKEKKGSNGGSIQDKEKGKKWYKIHIKSENAYNNTVAKL